MPQNAPGHRKSRWQKPRAKWRVPTTAPAVFGEDAHPEGYRGASTQTTPYFTIARAPSSEWTLHIGWSTE